MAQIITSPADSFYCKGMTADAKAALLELNEQWLSGTLHGILILPREDVVMEAVLGCYDVWFSDDVCFCLAYSDEMLYTRDEWMARLYEAARSHVQWK